MTATLDRAAGHRGYRHEALLYEGLDGFMAGTIDFIRDGIAADEPILVAVSEEKIARLRSALDGSAGHVLFADMAEVGRNPGRLIPVWRDFVATHRGTGPLRGIGEPVWAGRDEEELSECRQHEALLNAALEEDDPLWLVCPYDTTSLRASDLAAAHCSHPVVSDGDGTRPSDSYAGFSDGPSLLEEPLSPAPAGAKELEFGRRQLRSLRKLVEQRAVEAGVDRRRVSDLVVAASEMGTNSVRHGDGTGRLRLWETPGAFYFEVEDSGRIEDPLVGRARPGVRDFSGRGLWIVHQLCDLVQVRSGAAGTVVRVRTRTG